MASQSERPPKVGARAAGEQADRSALVDRVPLVIEITVYDFAQGPITTHRDDPSSPVGQYVACDFCSLARPRGYVFSEVDAEGSDLLARASPGSQSCSAS